MFKHALKHIRPGLVLMLLAAHSAWADNREGAVDLGVDYAFMSLMTLSPDFAAANYTIEDGDSDVDIAIGRLPYHHELMSAPASRLQLEIAVAYQITDELVITEPTAPEYIDARWHTYGISLGLLYAHALGHQLKITPSVRAGLVSMDNHATYSGVLTGLAWDQLDGTVFNWETRASVFNLGLGLEYEWTILDRESTLQGDVYHVIVDSTHESNAAVKFTEQANMLALKADMIFPTDLHLGNRRLDVVLLLGANEFFGENRHTLGYTTSYQAGLGWELPLKWSQTLSGHIRMSGQVLWADHMTGWMLTLGFLPQ